MGIKKSRLFTTGVLLGAAAAGESYRENHFFTKREYQVAVPSLLPKNQERTLVFLSDLHNHLYGEKQYRLVEKIREVNPDVILIGGDMLVGKGEVPFDNAICLYRELSGIAPMIAGTGNHEQRLKEGTIWERKRIYTYEKLARQEGVLFLSNESKEVSLRGIKVIVSAMEIPLEYYHLSSSPFLPLNTMRELLPAPIEGAYHILLAHSPRYFSTYRRWGASLTLSGHLHGGMVRLPKVGGVLSPQLELFPLYSGEMTTIEDKTMIVSRGLGSHTIPFRLGNKAEFVVIRLCGTKESLEGQ